MEAEQFFLDTNTFDKNSNKEAKLIEQTVKLHHMVVDYPPSLYTHRTFEDIFTRAYKNKSLNKNHNYITEVVHSENNLALYSIVLGSEENKQILEKKSNTVTEVNLNEIIDQPNEDDALWIDSIVYFLIFENTIIFKLSKDYRMNKHKYLANYFCDLLEIDHNSIELVYPKKRDFYKNITSSQIKHIKVLNQEPQLISKDNFLNKLTEGVKKIIREPSIPKNEPKFDMYQVDLTLTPVEGVNTESFIKFLWNNIEQNEAANFEIHLKNPEGVITLNKIILTREVRISKSSYHLDPVKMYKEMHTFLIDQRVHIRK